MATSAELNIQKYLSWCLGHPILQFIVQYFTHILTLWAKSLIWSYKAYFPDSHANPPLACQAAVGHMDRTQHTRSCPQLLRQISDQTVNENLTQTLPKQVILVSQLSIIRTRHRPTQAHSNRSGTYWQYEGEYIKYSVYLRLVTGCAVVFCCMFGFGLIMRYCRANSKILAPHRLLDILPGYWLCAYFSVGFSTAHVACIARGLPPADRNSTRWGTIVLYSIAGVCVLLVCNARKT